MITPQQLLAFLALPLLLLPAAAAGHYVPRQGDYLRYYETITLNGGKGNYTGYTENQYVNGTVSINSLQPNEVASAFYQYFWKYVNNTGGYLTGSSAGNFTFSYATYHYVNGTDNQTGYSNPFVWFYMNNSLAAKDQFYLLNTQMTVVSADYSYKLPSTGGYVKTIYAQGSGSYPRNDVYGQFTATYTWNTYFDPSTGYIVAYLYTEHDTNSAGDGFTYTELLYVTATSFSLTTGAAPPSNPSAPVGLLEVVGVVVIAAIILVVVTAVVLRSRARHVRRIPQHPSTGRMTYSQPPPGEQPSAPPTISLTAKQPPVQQIVVKEVVKVKCQYCGSLIDSTDLRCPVCGAPRS